MEINNEDPGEESIVLGLVQTLIELKVLLNAVVLAESVEIGASHCRSAMQRIDEALQAMRDHYLSARSIGIDTQAWSPLPGNEAFGAQGASSKS